MRASQTGKTLQWKKVILSLLTTLQGEGMEESLEQYPKWGTR